MNLFDLSAVLRLDTSQYEQGINNARSSARGLETALGNTDGALGKAQKGFTVFKGVLSNVIGSGVNALAGAITNNLGGAIARVDTINNYSTVMKNLGKSSKESEKAINQLVDGIDGLPTTLDGIVTVQQQFAALGGDMEDATKLTLALNNATLAGGRGQAVANSALQQWYQMIAAGKSDMMSMRIINEAMPAQMDAIAKSVVGADANWQDLHAEWQKNPEITQKVKDAILSLNKEGINGTAGFAKQAEDATKGIATSMQNLQTAIKNGIGNILNEIGKDTIAGVFARLKDAVKTAFGEIVTIMQNTKKFGFGEAIAMEIEKARGVVWDAFVKLMSIDWSSAFSTAFSSLGSAFTKAYDVALKWDTLRTNILQRIISVAYEMVTGFVASVIENAPAMGESAIEVVTNFATGIIDNLTALAGTAARTIDKFVEYLSQNSDSIINGAGRLVMALGRGIVQNAPKIAASVARLGLAITKGILKIVPKLPSLALRMVTALGRALAGGAGRISSSAKKLASSAVSALRSGFSKVGDIGLNIVKGIGNGITNGFGWIKARISEFVGNVKSFIKRVFKIGSPSKWARDEVGEMIDAGLALGISDNADMVDDAVEDLMPTVNTDRLVTNGVKPTSNGVKMSYPTVNTYVTVDGAEDPTAWGERFADTLETRLRMA